MEAIELIGPLLIILTILVSLSLFACYWYSVLPRKNSLEWIAMRAEERPRLTFALKRHPMERKDILPLLAVTVVYAFFAFFRLGDTAAVQSTLTLTGGESVSFSLSETAEVSELRFFSVLGTGSYTLSYSSDAVRWDSVSFKQPYNSILKWNTAQDEDEENITFSGRYFTLTAHPDGHTYENRVFLELGEMALFDGAGQRLAVAQAQGAEALFDEQDLVQEYFWTNSAYFDEIYHARTAYEHLENIYPYETTHPPLGKLIIAVGIWLFGLNPFGWRFMGTLFGVLMLPILYVFLKNLFGKTAVALCGAVLFAAEFMHLTQTRIATIDTYGVFFILAMYFFMYRWLTLDPNAPLSKTIPPLFLSGLMFGLGAASKWTVIYGGAGLAVLWLIGILLKKRDRSPETPFAGFFWGTVGLCLIFFVAIPAGIYILSYLPYAAASGQTTLSGLLEVMWDNQVFMLTYHQGATGSHPYSSRWYQWLLDIRPILYFREQDNIPGMKAAFSAFNNPLISWTGLLCVLLTAIETVRRRCAKALFIFLGWLAQFLPWVFIGRTTFAYHYFPSILFCVLAISYAMDAILTRRKPLARPAVYGFTACAAALFLLFYPELVGIYMPTWYTTGVLRWFPSWPL